MDPFVRFTVADNIKEAERSEKEIQANERLIKVTKEQKKDAVETFYRYALPTYLILFTFFLFQPMIEKNRIVSLTVMVLLPFTLATMKTMIEFFYDDRIDGYLERLSKLYVRKNEILKEIFNQKTQLERMNMRYDLGNGLAPCRCGGSHMNSTPSESPQRDTRMKSTQLRNPSLEDTRLEYPQRDTRMKSTQLEDCPKESPGCEFPRRYTSIQDPQRDSRKESTHIVNLPKENIPVRNTLIASTRVHSIPKESSHLKSSQLEVLPRDSARLQNPLSISGPINEAAAKHRFTLDPKSESETRPRRKCGCPGKLQNLHRRQTEVDSSHEVVTQHNVYRKFTLVAE